MEKFVAIVAGVLLIVGMSFLMAYPIMWLWNWLMPEIFGLIEISVGQALGLSVLSSLLIKNLSLSK